MHVTIAQNADQDRWDEYVSQHSQASPYHLFAWKQSIESAYQQKSYYLMALDEHKKLVGVLPGILVQPPFGKPILCSLPYCDRGEALSDSPQISQQLIEHARQLSRQTDAKRYEYRASKINLSDKNTEQADTSPQKVRMVLELPETSELLLSGFKAKLRSQIKKAEKNGLTYQIGTENSFITDFYQVFTTNMRDLGSPTHSLEWFTNIIKNYGKRAIISIVKYNDKVIGGGIVLSNANKSAIPWASTLREYNRLAPNMLLYWSLLKYATDNHNQQFDFGRSTPGEGTFKFKQQWGARPVALEWETYSENIDKIKGKLSPQQDGTARRLAENVWRKLPLPLTVQIGSRVRKYITL